MAFWQWASVILVVYVVIGRITYLAFETAQGGIGDPWTGLAWPVFWILNFGLVILRYVLYPIGRFVGHLLVWFFTKIFFPIFTKGIFPAIDGIGRKASVLVFHD